MRDLSAPCPFCTLPADRIWMANEHALAFRDGFPVSEGHTLVVPRRHVTSVFDVAGEEWSELWVLVASARRRLLDECRCAAVNVGINDGYAAGQTVPHGHIHLIPRYEGDTPDPRGGVRWIFPEKARYW